MIDTGIKFSHKEFSHMDGAPGSRVVPGFSVFGDNNSSDCYGHGTHTAATVGGESLDSLHCGSCNKVTVSKLLYIRFAHVASCCIVTL